MMLLPACERSEPPPASPPDGSQAVTQEPSEENESEGELLTEGWTENRRHFRKWREEIREMHQDFDRVIFDLENGAEEKTGTEEKETVKLEWIDKETEEVLFTIRDIEVFDWEKQIFKLSLEADRKLNEWGKSSNLPIRPYSLNDSEGTIYDGEIYIVPCSRPSIGPSIWLKDLGMHGKTLNPPLYQISKGWREDLRFSDRLKSSLEKAGVLGTIEIPEEK